MPENDYVYGIDRYRNITFNANRNMQKIESHNDDEKLRCSFDKFFFFSSFVYWVYVSPITHVRVCNNQ